MRVLVAEFIADGGLSIDETPPSLLSEGRAMRNAAVADLAAIAGLEVVTFQDAFSSFPRSSLGRRLGFEATLERALAGCDATFVIAPEFDGHLLRACRTVTAASVRWLGCTVEAIALCGDKWRLYEHLVASGVATIPTRCPEDFEPDLWPPPWVVKPRDGAGSLGIETFDTVDASRKSAHSNQIVQPLVVGRAVSIGLLVDASGRVTVLPVAEQRLSVDGRFAYLGGRVPIDDPKGLIALLAAKVVRTVPGLGGYVGIDILIPDADPDRPLVVEVNPRLTTSYIGYRALANENLLRRLVESVRTPVDWGAGHVVFDSAGNVTRQS